MKRQAKLLALALVLALLAGMLPAALAEEIPAETTDGGVIAVETVEDAAEIEDIVTDDTLVVSETTLEDEEEESTDNASGEAEAEEELTENSGAELAETNKESAIVVESIESAFPDATLRQVVMDRFDWNGDGKLDQDEIDGADWLDYVPEEDEPKITNLAGIENLKHLRGLRLGWNQVGDKSVKYIQKLTELEDLDVSNNGITSLDVTMLKNLDNLEVDCDYWDEGDHPVKLKTLKVAGLSKLENISAYNNELKTLDLTGLKNLHRLMVNNNKLTSLSAKSLANLEELECEGNALTALTVAGCANLHMLDLSNNKVAKLDLTGLAALEELQAEENPLKTLTLTKTNPTRIFLRRAALSSLNCSGMTNLVELCFQENTVDCSKVDVSGCTGLIFLNIGDSRIKLLNANGATALQQLYAYSNQLKTLNLSGASALEVLCINENQLTELDLTAFASLEDVDVNSNPLTSLKVANLKNLLYLYCGQTNLPALDASGCTSLATLALHDAGALEEAFYQGKTGESGGFVTYGGILTVPADTNIICGGGANEEVVVNDIDAQFPDRTLANYVRDSFDWEDEHGSGDGKLTVGEINGATEVWYEYPDERVSNLAGIEIFAYMQQVHLSNNNINDAGVKPLEKLTRVVNLDLSNNPITRLDVSSMKHLKSLFLNGWDLDEADRLATLTLTGLTNLREVEVCGTNLTSLDLGGNAKLRYVNIQGCDELQRIYAAGETGRDGNNVIYGDGKLVIPAQAEVFTDDLDDFIIVVPSIQAAFPDARLREFVRERFDWEDDRGVKDDALSKREINEANDIYLPGPGVKEWEDEASDTALTSLEGVQLLTELEWLWVQGNDLTDGAIAPIKDLQNLRGLGLQYNKLTKLDVSGLTSLEELRCDNNQIATLTLGSKPNLWFLECGENPLTSLNVSSLTNLEELHCYECQLTSLPVENMTGLRYLSFSDNKITGTMDLSKLTNLESLWADGNGMSSLKGVGKLTKLVECNVSGNNIGGALNLSAFKDLEYLWVYKTGITALTLPASKKLHGVNASDNPLKALDTTQTPNLEWLCFDGCDQLETLNMGKQDGLRYLYAMNIKLPSVELGNCATLCAYKDKYQKEYIEEDNWDRYFYDENDETLAQIMVSKDMPLNFGAPTLNLVKKGKRTMYAGELLQLLNDKGIKSCKSSNKKVASVTKGGLITARKAGKAKITVTLKNKKKIVLTLTIKK